MSEQKNMPYFENGLAQPVFPFTDGKTGSAYNAETSDIVRYCVYVETDFDLDGDGKRDLVKAFVQVPRSAAEGNYKAGTIYEARPYSSGIQYDAYDHMKEVEDDVYPEYDMSRVNDAPARKPAGCISALEAAAQADPSSWHYIDQGYHDGETYCYDNIDLYDYYLIRGFAVVQSAGLGTLGSEGFEAVGTTYERDAFKAVVEWLHGDRAGYTDRTGNIQTKADWSNGKVGMTGRSYGGTMPFAVASTGVEGLVTIAPVAGIADWYSFLNQQGAQRYWPKEMLMSFLSYYCSSRYSDPELTDEERKKFAGYQYQMSRDQIRHGFDYAPEFWDGGNYTLNADKIRCSALIIHGLNDENVSTKQFEMMRSSFKKAGQDVKLLLHQGYHMTPTMVLKGYGFLIDGQAYDDILNQWFSHYLYDVDNGAENRPDVLVQSNRDQHVWEKADSWETAHKLILKNQEAGETVLDTDWEKAGVNKDNFDEKMSLASSNMNQRYLSGALDKDAVIQGTVKVDFRAALKDGDPADAFHSENVNDVDKLSFAIGTDSGFMDDVKMTVLLCDLSDEAFTSFQTVDPERNEIPLKTVSRGTLINGGSLDNFDVIEFEEAHKTYKVITRAYIDLCNPDSGYAPETSAGSITLKPGEFHNYSVYLNTQRYTVSAGHKLAVVLDTEDPVNCMMHKQYVIAVDDASVQAEIPVTEEISGPMELHK